MPLIKSDNDKRFYRLIELSNGLRALLVSSAANQPESAVRRSARNAVLNIPPAKAVAPKMVHSGGRQHCSAHLDEYRTEKMAAAALVVKVGSFQDPVHIPGLAHFLDHMLLLGSEKYPREGEYLEYICKNGGSINATTAVDMTMFRFDTSQAAFATALDMFANFFINPLFREDAIEREVCAVESEFQLEQVSDIRRSKEIMARLAGDQNPMGRFVWGNFRTLRDGPRERGLNIRNELIKFYNSYYSADVMTLCVHSKHSLDELEQFVRTSFSQVPRQKRVSIEYPRELPYKHCPDFCKLIKIIPVNRILSAVITWVIPPQSGRYTSRSIDYILYVVGYGGMNSILDHLRRMNWAFELATGPVIEGFDNNNMCALFTINITLTEQGAEHFGEVLRVLHQYLHMIRKKGPQRWLWEELQYMAELEFRFQGEEEPADYVCRMSKSMQLYREEHYLTADDLYHEYDPANIQAILDLLVPESCNTILMDHNFQRDADLFTRREPFMGAMYRIEDYPECWTRYWGDDPKFQTQFNMPEDNPYRPIDLSIKQEAAYSNEPYPVVILDRPRARLWYRKDQKFLVPRAFINLHLVTMLPYMSIEGAICIEIMTHALAQRLGPLINYAEMASISCDVNGFNWGTTICVGGFSQKLPLLLESVLDALIRFDISDELFHMLKLKLSKLYHNKVLTNNRYGYEICAAVIHRSTTIEKRREALRPITKYDVIDNTRRLCATAYIEAYFHGNLTSVEARDLISKVEMKFSATPMERRMNQQSPVIAGETYVRCLGINPEDRSSRIVNYYIHGPAHFYEETMMQLLVKLMEPHCIIQLRTKQQFGYDACCSMYNCGGVIGFIVSVSPAAYRFTLSYVDEKIDEYVDSMICMVNELGQSEFNMVRDALIRAKQRADLSMAGEQRRHWERIVQFDYMFEQNHFEVKFLKTLELNRFRRWALRLLPARGRDRKKLSVQIVGHGQVAVEECLGGQELWRELQQFEGRRMNSDIELPIPPMRLLAPLNPGRKLFVRDFEAFVSHCEYYPPARRDPRARVDF